MYLDVKLAVQRAAPDLPPRPSRPPLRHALWIRAVRQELSLASGIACLKPGPVIRIPLEAVSAVFLSEAQMMKKAMLICFTLLILGGAGCQGKISPEEEAAAVDVASNWLHLMDAGQYAAGWKQTSEYLRKGVSEDKWVETMLAARKPMGSPVSRKIKSTQHRIMMPGTLKGNYVLIQYQTLFSNRRNVVESATLMKEKDGVWRVAGYHIN
jgi:Protein of unknown function (DUF4019)